MATPKPIPRAVGLVLCLLPCAVVLGSLLVGLHRGGACGPASVVVISVALLSGVLNFFLSCIRPSLVRRRPKGEQRNVSVAPLFGTVLVVTAALLAFGSLPVAAVGLVTLVIDMGGVPWFVIWTWRDESFWRA